MYSPLVSVIIPTYNSSETILECINSVLFQTYSNIEILVIDDGSIDATISILSKLIVAEKDKIQLFQQINSGPSVARNKGIFYAKGEYIAFLDSDDSWYPQKIEKQIELYSRNENLVLAGTLYSIGNKQVFPRSLSGIRNISLIKLMLKNYFVTSTVMCPRKILKEYNFKEDQRYAEDYRLWLQLANLGTPCILQNEVLTKMNDKPLWGAKGLSSKLWLMEKGELNNFNFMYSHSYISLFLYFISVIYSVLKYIRRLLLYKLK